MQADGNIPVPSPALTSLNALGHCCVEECINAVIFPSTPLPPPLPASSSTGTSSLLSISLFHGSEINSVVSAPRERGRSLGVFELKRETTPPKKAAVKIKKGFLLCAYADAVAVSW